MAHLASRISHLVLGATLAGGCATDGGSRAPAASVTDSAGIAIVTSSAPDSVIEPTLVWSVGGSDDGNPLLQVTDLAVTGAGVLLVANSGSAEVLAYDATGALEWRFGRRGAGPGEFQRALSVAAIGDSAFAYEFSLGRLTVIAPGGAFARVQQFPLEGPNTELYGAFGDGSLLLAERHLTDMKPGLNTDSAVYRRVSTTGISLGVIGWERAATVDFVMAGMGPNLHEQAFGPVAALATAGDWLARTTGRDAEVRLSDPSGRLRRIVRWEETAAAVTDADREAYRAARLAEAQGEMVGRMVEDWLAHATFADRVPVTGLVAVGTDGRVLVSAYCGPGAGHDGCPWRVFDADGRWVRTLRLPVRATDAVLLGELLVTLSEDADGVERLDAWTIAGASSAAAVRPR